MQSLTTSLTIGSCLVALTLLAGVARAQDEEDGPPAGLLSHVKVGQRYTFVWSSGDLSTEELWHVAEVHPDRVLYLRTNRTRQGERVLIETVDDELTEWSWGATPVVDAAAQAIGKVTQRRSPFEVVGTRFDCVVTKVAELETWTAVKGDLETFPGVVQASTKEASLRRLTKIEDGPPPVVPERREEEPVDEESGLPPGALDHVKVGQRWVFDIDHEGMKAELVWTVKEVHAAEGRVVYTLKTTARVDGTTVTTDDGEEAEWSGRGSPVIDDNVKVDGMSGARRVLEVSGLKLDCYVLTITQGEFKTEAWTAVKGDHEVFPGLVKQIVEGQGGVMQLVRVEGP